MRALVTGGAAGPAAEVAARLAADGHEVVDGRGVELVDPTAPGAIAGLGPELVVHLGALDPVAPAPAGVPSAAVADAERVVLGVVRVLEGARAAGSRRVVVAVADPVAAGPPPGRDRGADPRGGLGAGAVARRAAALYAGVYDLVFGLDHALVVVPEGSTAAEVAGAVAAASAGVAVGPAGNHPETSRP